MDYCLQPPAKRPRFSFLLKLMDLTHVWKETGGVSGGLRGGTNSWSGVLSLMYHRGISVYCDISFSTHFFLFLRIWLTDTYQCVSEAFQLIGGIWQTLVRPTLNIKNIWVQTRWGLYNAFFSSFELLKDGIALLISWSKTCLLKPF